MPATFYPPNFDNPVAILTDTNFGRLSQMLGSGPGGLSVLYLVRGDRAQFSSPETCLLVTQQSPRRGEM